MMSILLKALVGIECFALGKANSNLQWFFIHLVASNKAIDRKRAS